MDDRPTVYRYELGFESYETMAARRELQEESTRLSAFLR